MPEPNEGWLSMNQLAERYDVHPMTVQRWRSAGTSGRVGRARTG